MTVVPPSNPNYQDPLMSAHPSNLNGNTQESTLLVHESSPLLDKSSAPRETRKLCQQESSSSLRHLIQHLTPSELEEDDRHVINWYQHSTRDDERENEDASSPRRGIRTTKRRLFLFLTEPSTSLASALFYAIMILTITVSNVIMILQTMAPWQYIPSNCLSCGGTMVHPFEDDETLLVVNSPATSSSSSSVPCVCPPAPLPYTVEAENWIIVFLTVEWVLRVLLFEPAAHNKAKTLAGVACQWVSFLLAPSTLMDALAIFPYYLERFKRAKGFLSFRLLRVFRVFQLLRLGQYSQTFHSFTNVMTKSVVHLKLLLILLIFGAAFFGSMVFWLERGDWSYWEETGDYQYVRLASNGISREISPFYSIPQAFWWFLVTATTVGYGDVTPTSTGGKCVAIAAMLTGVLVIAFPVSVFSDLWHKELASYHGTVVTEEGVVEYDDDDDELLEEQEDARGAVVTMDLRDFNQLAVELRNMELAHSRIRGILEKYDIKGC